jgi:hypothetical protein
MQGKKRRLSEVQKWYFRLMNDPEQFEKEAFIDGINTMKRVINEFQKMYEGTSATDHILRMKILNGMEQSKITLSKIQADYEMFKKYIRRELQ